MRWCTVNQILKAMNDSFKIYELSNLPNVKSLLLIFTQYNYFQTKKGRRELPRWPGISSGTNYFITVQAAAARAAARTAVGAVLELPSVVPYALFLSVPGGPFLPATIRF